jgi:hypothetical protein
MTIFEALKTDHRQIKKLCKQIESEVEESPKKAASTFGDLAVLLVKHTKAEEAALYDRMKEGDEEARDLGFEGYEEHHVADFVVDELKALSSEKEEWAAKFGVLKELLNHHIEEEEEEMFSAARESLEKADLKEARDEFLSLRKGGRAPARQTGKRPAQGSGTQVHA